MRNLLGVLLLLSSAAAATCQPLHIDDADSGAAVVGVEDIAVDPGTGIAYLSTYDRRGNAAGGIYALDLKAWGAAPPARLQLAKLVGGEDFRPHGIGLWRGEVLFVVNRRSDGPTLDSFTIAADRLIPRRRISDPLFCNANDVAAIDGERVLLSLDHQACGWSRGVENLLNLKRGKVILVEPGQRVTVISGLGFANGLWLDGPRLHVAATREKAVYLYDLSGEGKAMTARLRRKMALDAAPDNLSSDGAGGVIAAAHPDLFRYWLYRLGLIGRDRLDFAVERLGADAKETTVRKSGLLGGATVAARIGRWLLLGAAYDDHLLLCDKEGVF